MTEEAGGQLWERLCDIAKIIKAIYWRCVRSPSACHKILDALTLPYHSLFYHYLIEVLSTHALDIWRGGGVDGRLCPLLC
jgi:hypothetical protein